MRNEEAFFFVFGCGVFVLVLVAMRHAHAERLQRLRILENALQDPKVDPATRQELIRNLESSRKAGVWGAWRTWLTENLTPRRVFGALGFGLVAVGGLMAALGGRYYVPQGIATLAVGIAILALPIVLRELDQRAARR
ncbi:MAG: hypothetical protein R3F56_08780 [Planctomycetota bacterium]